ncbi:MAG: hypothetical protein RIC95_05920 [Vicingaceae bacterium]
MKNGLLILFLLGASLSACYQSYRSVLVADSYNEEENLSTLTLIPYGEINIPGKWKKTHYNESSSQHYFDNEDSVTLAVTLNPQENYSFYTKSMNDSSFVSAFYQWEKSYFEKQGVQIKKLEQGNNYIIWSAKAEGVNSVFLYGSKRNIAYNLGFLDNLWEDKKRISFLKKLFENN